MYYGTLIIDDNIRIANKINKYIHKLGAQSIAFMLGNFKLNGCPFMTSKDNRTKKLLKLGFDLVIEIPSIIYLNNISDLCNYISNTCKKLNISKMYLPSEFSSLKSFKQFHSKFNFYYPSYDNVFHYYLDNNDFVNSKILTNNYIRKFYRLETYDYLNLNIINTLKKNQIKIKLIKGNFTLGKTVNEIEQKYFELIKLYFTLNSSSNILINKQIDINTINMIKKHSYKLFNFNELEKLSAPKNFQYSSFFRSILLSIVNYNKDNILNINEAPIKCLGINRNGSKIIRDFKKNNKDYSHLFVNSIIPSNSMIEEYQMKIELLYSYLYNKYNANSDLFKFPIKIKEKY